MQDLYTKMPQTRHDIEAFDCHIVEQDVGGEDFAGGKGEDMKLIVVASGTVLLGPPQEPLDCETKQFTDHFFLVPNNNIAAAKRKTTHPKKWLIQNQTYRFVNDVDNGGDDDEADGEVKPASFGGVAGSIEQEKK